MIKKQIVKKHTRRYNGKKKNIKQFKRVSRGIGKKRIRGKAIYKVSIINDEFGQILGTKWTKVKK